MRERPALLGGLIIVLALLLTGADCRINLPKPPQPTPEPTVQPTPPETPTPATPTPTPLPGRESLATHPEWRGVYFADCYRYQYDAAMKAAILRLWGLTRIGVWEQSTSTSDPMAVAALSDPAVTVVVRDRYGVVSVRRGVEGGKVVEVILGGGGFSVQSGTLSERAAEIAARTTGPLQLGLDAIYYGGPDVIRPVVQAVVDRIGMAEYARRVVDINLADEPAPQDVQVAVTRWLQIEAGMGLPHKPVSITVAGDPAQYAGISGLDRIAIELYAQDPVDAAWQSDEVARGAILVRAETALNAVEAAGYQGAAVLQMYGRNPQERWEWGDDAWGRYNLHNGRVWHIQLQAGMEWVAASAHRLAWVLGFSAGRASGITDSVIWPVGLPLLQAGARALDGLDPAWPSPPPDPRPGPMATLQVTHRTTWRAYPGQNHAPVNEPRRWGFGVWGAVPIDAQGRRWVGPWIARRAVNVMAWSMHGCADCTLSTEWDGWSATLAFYNRNRTVAPPIGIQVTISGSATWGGRHAGWAGQTMTIAAAGAVKGVCPVHKAKSPGYPGFTDVVIRDSDAAATCPICKTKPPCPCP